MSKAAEAGRPSLSGLKFLVEEVLSTDAHGSVMRIGDKATPGKLYALKVVGRAGPDDDGKLRRCQAAAEGSAKCGHPAILKYHDYRDRKSWFKVVRGELLMEHVAGTSLAKLPTTPTPSQWILIFKQVADALAHMHRRGVLHGDLTPARILLARTGGVKVMGYGQSLLKDPNHRTTTKLFAAPEQAREKTIDEKTEVYALGAMMYFLLTGKTPNALRNKSDDEAVKIPRPSAIAPKVPAALDDVILPCVQRQPGKRPEGMFDVVKSLEALTNSMSLDPGSLAGVAAPKAE